MPDLGSPPSSGGSGVPAGGSTGQVLKKNSGTSGDAGWTDTAVLSNETPQPPGTAIPGTSPEAARVDHVHPDNGLHWGSGVPSNAVGGDSATYIDYTNGRIYGPKTSGAWPGTYISVSPRFDPSQIAGFVDSWSTDRLLLADGDEVTSWLGTNGRVFAPPGTGPTFVIDPETGIRALSFTHGINRHLVASAAITYKHAFVVAKMGPIDGAWNDFEGLLTGPSGSDYTLNAAEVHGVNPYFDLLSGETYRLNGTALTGTGALAPVDAYGVISVSHATGWTSVPQIGLDRDNITRCWQGHVVEILLYNAVLTGTDLTDVEQYLRGKYGIAP